MKVGSTIKWTDDKGDETLGKVTHLTKDRVKFQTKDKGILDVLLTDGVFELSKEKLDLEEVPEQPEPEAPKKKDKEPEAPAPTAAKKKGSRDRRAPTVGSKTEHALKVFQSMSNSSRQEVIKAFIDKVGLTPSGAATYYTNCKKRLAK